MIIDLRELSLRDGPLEVNTAFSEQELKISSPLVSLDKPVGAQMMVSLSGECVRVRGSLEASVSLTCCRCAKVFPQNLAREFTVEYWPDPGEEEIELTYDDLDVGFYRDDQLDLCAIISEQIFLDMPMKPVCQPDCRGLCDQCGVDLNESTCRCDRPRVDPRLAALMEFKKRLN